MAQRIILIRRTDTLSSCIDSSHKPQTMVTLLKICDLYVLSNMCDIKDY